jgi:hypothetical protein
MEPAHVMYTVAGAVIAALVVVLVGLIVVAAVGRVEGRLQSMLANRLDSLILEVTQMRSDLTTELKGTHRVAILAAGDANALTRRVDSLEQRFDRLIIEHRHRHPPETNGPVPT